ncbi:MAG TPA: MFS transporter [Thermoplasmata archaeon]|nr:MFS transporter [Thermoplasmata archaeon]
MVAYKWTVLSNTTMGALLASLDGTILLIAMPVVLRGVGVNPFLPSSFPILIWLLLGYGVVTATLLVTVGRLSDMFGRARMYNTGFAIFSTGSIFLFLDPWSGTAGAWALVGFRLIQALGASFLFANSAALITDAFPANERGKAIGINQVAFIGGSLVGLVVGGVLASIPTLHFGALVLPTWRLIFLVSVPVGVLGTIWAYAKLHETSIRRAGQRIDFLGNGLFAIGLTLVLVATTYGLLPYGSSSMGWSSPWVEAALVSGLALLVAFLYVETRVADPMFRLGLFRVRSFAAGNITAFLGSLARGGMMLLLVLWFQGIWLPLHGYSFAETPFWAGVLMMPMIAGFLVAGPLSGHLSDTRGPKLLATAGMAIASATFFGLVLLPTNFAYWEMGLLLFAQGCGMGMFAAPNAAAVMNSVPPENRGVASGMLATLQNTGQQVSLAIFFTIVIIGLASGLGTSVHQALGAAQVGAADTQILGAIVAGNPTGALFGAFLGENPMSVLLQGAALVPGWTPLSTSVAQTLLAPHFFASAIAPAFAHALGEAFLFAGVVTAVGAVVSSVRGDRYVYGEELAGPRRNSPPTVVVSPPEPVAVTADAGGGTLSR